MRTGLVKHKPNRFDKGQLRSNSFNVAMDVLEKDAVDSLAKWQ